MTPQFRDITSSSDLFDVAVFLLSILVTGPSSMSISLLVLELGHFFYKGLTRNLEIRNTPHFCPLTEDWEKLGIPNLAQMLVIKCYRVLQNARVTALTVSELLRQNQ